MDSDAHKPTEKDYLPGEASWAISQFRCAIHRMRELRMYADVKAAMEDFHELAAELKRENVAAVARKLYDG